MKKHLYISALATLALITVHQHAYAQLLHLWDFPAGNVYEDSAGGLDLMPAVGEGSVTIDDNGTPDDTDDDIVQMGDAGDISFEPGFYGHGLAYRPSYVDPSMSSTAGAGLTGSGFTSPSQFTIMALLKADQKTTGSAVNYIFQTRPGSDRGYYLVQDEDGVPRGTTSGIGSIVGNNFSDTSIPFGHNDDSNWVFVALALDLSQPTGAIGNLFVADVDESLSPASNASLLAEVVTGKSWGTAMPNALAGSTGIFGIGNFAIDRDGNDIAEASQEWFQGAIDWVKIHNGLLDEAEIGVVLEDMLTVPEPSSLALFIVALSAGLVATRRRI